METNERRQHITRIARWACLFCCSGPEFSRASPPSRTILQAIMFSVIPCILTETSVVRARCIITPLLYQSVRAALQFGRPLLPRKR